MTIFIIRFADLLFTALNLAILGRVLLSWINPDPYHPVVQFLFQITEPILGPIRRNVPPMGMIDISPIIAILLLEVLHRIILQLLTGTLL